MKKFLALVAITLLAPLANASVFDECSFFDYACKLNYAGPVEEVHSFADNQHAESIGIDSNGNKIVTLALQGKVLKVFPDGTEETLATLPVGVLNIFTFQGVAGGLTIDMQDNVYVAVGASDPANRGVWKVDALGNAALLAQMPLTSAPNGIAIHGDDVIIADSLGALWKADRFTPGPAVLLSNDPLLAPIPGFPIPGPNGIQVYGDTAVVAVSATGLVVAFDLVAETASVHAVMPVGIAGFPQGGDDFAMDVFGRIYMTTDYHQTVIRVNLDGSFDEVMSAADGLDGPTAAVFGRSSGYWGLENLRLYVTTGNFPFGVPPGFPADPGHGGKILGMDTGITGYPRHLNVLAN